jgi:HK97 gp10 family phage protein
VKISVRVIHNRLPAIIAKAPGALGDAVRETAIAIEQDVKGGPHAAPYRTGNLRRSYHHAMSGPASAVVGSDHGIAEYAPYVEFGTSKMSAQPHLVPATEAQREPFAQRVAKALRGLA